MYFTFDSFPFGGRMGDGKGKNWHREGGMEMGTGGSGHWGIRELGMVSFPNPPLLLLSLTLFHRGMGLGNRGIRGLGTGTGEEAGGGGKGHRYVFSGLFFLTPANHRLIEE